MNTTTTKTAHKTDCKMAFGRKDGSCPRCQELLAGSAPRAGWSDMKRRHEAMFIRSVREHVCTVANCGPVCTFGDW